ncbi:MAG: hypothetical protein HON70_10010, partial [Lentisphaerae bacterium]|nr:hypothetical protein [Lentisphaerota bacterium]
CFTFPDVDGSSRPVTSLAKNAPKSQGQDLAEAVADVLRFADTRNPGRVFDVSFHGGVTTALKDAILEELRTQGAKAGIADE